MRLGGLVLALTGWMFVISCSGAGPTEPFMFQMDWTHEAEFAGLYTAQNQGFFRDAGLSVTLTEGPAGTDVPGILASGQADAAQMGMTMYLNAASRDPDLIAIMALLQTSERVLLTKEDRHAKRPRDLEGMRIGIKSSSWSALIRKILINDGADPKKITEIPVHGEEIDRFYRGEVDVWTGFATAEPVKAQLAGYQVNLLFADDFGAGGYDELIVVKRSALDENKDKYRKFLEAVVRGWGWSSDHEPETVSELDRRQPGETHEFHLLAWKALRPLVVTGRVPIGWIENARWPAGVPYTADLLDRP